MIKGILPRELEEIATVQTERRSSSNRSKQTGDTGNGATNDMAPLYSEEALAQKFTERHASKARYVAAWGQWLRYDGISWVFDDTLHAFDDAREICREAAAACNKGGPAKTIASAKTVAAVEKLAKADRRHASTTNQMGRTPAVAEHAERHH